MKNATTTIKANKLTITVDLTQDFGRSKQGTGPNLIIATSSGNKVVGMMPDGRPVTVGLNIYTQPKAGQ